MPIVTVEEMKARDLSGAYEAFEMELVREFFARRPWTHDASVGVISEDDYRSLKARDGRFWGSIDEGRRMYLRGFVDGWKSSRK